MTLRKHTDTLKPAQTQEEQRPRAGERERRGRSILPRLMRHEKREERRGGGGRVQIKRRVKRREEILE